MLNTPPEWLKFSTTRAVWQVFFLILANSRVTAVTPDQAAPCISQDACAIQHIQLVFDGGVRGKPNSALSQGHGRFILRMRQADAPCPDWLRDGSEGGSDRGFGRGGARNFGLYVSAPAAEYLALHAGLGALLSRARAAGLDTRALRVQLVTDSEVLARQLTGEYATDAPHLREHQARVRARLEMLGRWEIRWQPRERVNTLLAAVPEIARSGAKKSAKRQRRRPTVRLRQVLTPVVAVPAGGSSAAGAIAGPASGEAAAPRPLGRPRLIRLPAYPTEAQIDQAARERAARIVARQTWKTALSSAERIEIQTRFEREKIMIALAQRAGSGATARLADISAQGLQALRAIVTLLRSPAAQARSRPAAGPAPDPLQGLARAITTRMIGQQPGLVARRDALEAEVRAALPGRIDVLTTRIQGNPAQFGLGALPHLEHARDGRYARMVAKLDAAWIAQPVLLAHSLLRGLSRAALIAAAWRIEQRKATGGPLTVFAPGAPRGVPNPAADMVDMPPAPCDATRVYPDMALAALKGGHSGAYRLWLLAHFLDARGTGVLTLEALREYVVGRHAVYSQRQLMSMLAAGEGVFWARYQRGHEIVDALGRRRRVTRSVLRVIGHGRVAAALGVARLRVHAVNLPVTDLLGGMAAVNAALFASFHAGRGQAEAFNAPIARATLEDLSGRSPAAQRAHDKTAGTQVRRNYARTGVAARPEALAHARLRHGRAAFVAQDAFLRKVRGQGAAAGLSAAIVIQLPNSYRPDARLSRAGPGRKRRINQALAGLSVHLVDMGERGTSQDTPLRRYFDTADQAKKKRGQRDAAALKLASRAGQFLQDRIYAQPRVAQEIAQLRTATFWPWRASKRAASVTWARTTSINAADLFI